MKTKQNASDRLSKKLSALRATLPADERAIFDGMIKVEEVTGHQMKVTRAAVKTGQKTGQKVNEVDAHQMKVTRAAVKTGQKTGQKVNEVDAHQMKVTRAAVKTGQKTGQKVNEVDAHQMKTVKPQIRYDVDSEEYKPVEG